MKFFHIANEEDLESILEKGLKKNIHGRVNLTMQPEKWLELHKRTVVLEVEVPETRIMVQDKVDVISFEDVPKDKVKLYDYKLEEKVTYKLKSLTDYIKEKFGHISLKK